MKTKKKAKLRKRAWVKIDFEHLHPAQRPSYEHYKGKRFIYVGEIPNQQGHALIMELGCNGEKLGRSGVIVLVVHVDELIELTDDET